MIFIATGTPREAKREVEDINMSRYACYLAVQNADSSKMIVAKAQTYFTIQTRRQEVHDLQIEDTKRIFSVLHKLTQNLGVKISMDKVLQIMPIMRLVKKFVQRLKNWAALCQRNYPQWKILSNLKKE